MIANQTDNFNTAIMSLMLDLDLDLSVRIYILLVFLKESLTVRILLSVIPKIEQRAFTQIWTFIEVTLAVTYTA